MDLTTVFEQTLTFIEQHRAWAGLIFGLMAFGESMVVIGVLIPATTVMLGAGALVGAGTLPFLDLWIGGAIGAALGDTLSYWIGLKLGTAVHRLWPFSRHPEMLAAARALFARWGWLAVWIGRFIGPLRASVPTFAGVAEMRPLTFQLANFGSAIAWIPVLIFPGSMGAWAWQLFASGDRWAGVAVALGLLAVVLGVWAGWRRLLPHLMRSEPKKDR